MAEIYKKVTGVKIRWGTEEEFLETHPRVREVDSARWAWIYDRRYNRDVDASKVLGVTGLTQGDFTSIEDGLRHELNLIQTKA